MDDDQLEAASEALMDEIAALIQGKPALSAIIALAYMSTLVMASQSACHPEHAPSLLAGWQAAGAQGVEDGSVVADLGGVPVAQNAPSSSTVN